MKIFHSLTLTASAFVLATAGNVTATPEKGAHKAPTQQKAQAKAPKKASGPARFVPDAQAKNIKFKFIGAVITGSSLFKDTDVQRAFSKFKKGSMISLKDVNDVARSLTNKYHNNGLVLSQVDVAQRAPHHGNIELMATEGKIRKVVLTGKIKGPKSRIEGFMNQIVTGKPAHQEELERSVLLTKSLPGLVVKKSTAVEVPGQKGIFDYKMDIDHTTASTTLTTNNRGSKAAGLMTVSMRNRFASALGMYEQIDLGFNTVPNVSEKAALNAGLTYLIGDHGLKLNMGLDNLSAGNPSGPAERFRAYNEGTGLSMGLSYPLILSKLETLNVNGKFSYTNSYSDRLDKRVTEDKIRTVTVGTDYNLTDTLKGKNSYGLRVTRGVNMFNASIDGIDRLKSNPRAQSTFTRTNWTIRRDQNFNKFFDASLEFKGQFTRDILFGNQRISYGGSGLGSGFDGGAISGDRGVTGRAEVTYTMRPGYKFLDRAVVYTFFDGANIQSIQGRGRPANRTFTEVGFSTGLGARLTLNKIFSGMIEVVKPIRHVTSTTQDMQPRVFGGLTARFDF